MFTQGFYAVSTDKVYQGFTHHLVWRAILWTSLIVWYFLDQLTKLRRLDVQSNRLTSVENLTTQEDGKCTISGLNFYKLVKSYEKQHLIYIVLTTYKKKIEKRLLEHTKFFFFYKLTKKLHIKKKKHHLWKFIRWINKIQIVEKLIFFLF